MIQHGRNVLKTSIILVIFIYAPLATSIPSLNEVVTASTQSNNEKITNPANRNDVKAFINHMVEKFHFKQEKMRRIFSQVHLRPRIIKTIHNPKEATPWYKYKRLFLSPQRINAGVTFWQNHQDKLKKAEQQYGVPAHIILGVLGVETFYGTRAGKHCALDALATLAFNYPERSKFFTSELEALFLLSREQHLDPLALKSSYAGALGFPQFMPSSYRSYAVDYSGDDIADLMHSPEDAIGSVANYLSKRGAWRAGEPIAEKAKLTTELDLDPKQARKICTIDEWKQQGILPLHTLKPDTKASAFQLQEEQVQETWLGFHNFKAILSYNPRINYAMAVMSLGEAIEAAKKAQSQTHAQQWSHA